MADDVVLISYMLKHKHKLSSLLVLVLMLQYPGLNCLASSKNFSLIYLALVDRALIPSEGRSLQQEVKRIQKLCCVTRGSYVGRLIGMQFNWPRGTVKNQCNCNCGVPWISGNMNSGHMTKTERAHVFTSGSLRWDFVLLSY